MLRVRLVRLATLGTVLGALAATAPPALADRVFSPRFAANDSGDIVMAANTLLSCPSGDERMPGGPGGRGGRQAGQQPMGDGVRRRRLRFLDVQLEPRGRGSARRREHSVRGSVLGREDDAGNARVPCQRPRPQEPRAVRHPDERRLCHRNRGSRRRERRRPRRPARTRRSGTSPSSCARAAPVATRWPTCRPARGSAATRAGRSWWPTTPQRAAPQHDGLRRLGDR